MKFDTKIMCQRLEELQLAEELGNVSRVCRERGISQSQFYLYRKAIRPRRRNPCLSVFNIIEFQVDLVMMMRQSPTIFPPIIR